MQALRTLMEALDRLLHSLVLLAACALYDQLVKRWPALRQQGRRIMLGELATMLQNQRTLREQTQRAAAEECGVHTSLYGRLERGEDVNTVEVLVKVCAWLGINPREIDYEMDTPTRRHVYVGVPACDSGPPEPSGVQREPSPAGPDRGAGAAEQ